MLGIVDETEYEQLKALQAELAHASQGLLAWPKTLPGGTWIDRPELTELLNRLHQPNSATAILGDPGAGKSALLATLGEALSASGWPVLAIKADLLDPGVTTEADLQARLDLPEKPSAILQRLGKLRPAVLLIDQLDALASYLDVRTGRLSVLLNLVRRLGRVDNIHIVLSARTFEYEHDVRLRSIAAESITLQLPAWSQVLPLLEARGIHAAGWPPDAREVMRSPQALSTYLQLEGRAKSEPFATYHAMLDRLWAERVLAGEGGSRRAKLACDVADRMAEEESLWLASARFDSQIDDVRALTAAGVLAPYGSDGSIGFTHQTLFDYALARGFTQTKGRLSQYALERQTSLFLRPKLRAALSYMRSVERPTYEAELETIWGTPGLRRHLRLLLIDFLGQQSTPTDREALVMEGVLQQPSDRALGFRALTGSVGWFERFASSFIATAMGEENGGANLTVGVLLAAWSFAPERVTELIASRWLPDPANDAKAWAVIENCPSWTEAVLEQAIAIVRRSEIGSFHIDNTISVLGASQPQAALRLCRARLDRELALALGEAAERAKDPKPGFEDLAARLEWRLTKDPRARLKRLLDDDREWDSLPALAERAPQDLLEQLWPWFLEALDALRTYEGGPHEGSLSYALPYDADFRFERESNLGLPAPAMLTAFRIAAEYLAEANPKGFSTWMQQQDQVDATPVHRLVAHGLASQPETFAKTALDYLLADPRRFHLGSVEDLSSTTKRLIEVSSPFWADAELRRFEAAVAAYAPPARTGLDPAGRRNWQKMIRLVRLDLLRRLPQQRTSSVTRRRIVEEARAFPGARLGAHFSGAHSIGSIMQADAIGRASDEDIIRAFQTLPDATGWTHPKNWDVGGNIQLAREFATFARTDAERARRLIARFKPDFGERAAGYALEAMAETGDPEAISALFVNLAERGFGGEEYRGSAAHAIRRLIDRRCPVGVDVISTLERWLANPVQKPVPDEPARSAENTDDEKISSGAGQTQRGGGGEKDEEERNLLWGYGGISIVPGGEYPVLAALIRLRLARQEPDLLIQTLFDSLPRVQDPRIWEALLDLLAYLQPGSKDRRAKFLAAVFNRFPQLLGTADAARLFGRVHWWAPNMVRKELNRWRQHPNRHALRGYGELVALVAILQPGLKWPRSMLKEIETGEEDDLASARTGAAFTAVNLWTEPKTREAATALLTRLLARREHGIWLAVFDLFRVVEELVPEPQTIVLLQAIADHVSSAPRGRGTYIVERLETLLPHEASLVAVIANGLVGRWRDDLGDIRTSMATIAPQLVDLAVTLHRLGPETREIGTTLFEQLVEIDAHMARQTLDEIDNRFRSERTFVRQRLPRRSMRRPVRA